MIQKEPGLRCLLIFPNAAQTSLPLSMQTPLEDWTMSCGGRAEPLPGCLLSRLIVKEAKLLMEIFIPLLGVPLEFNY